MAYKVLVSKRTSRMIFNAGETVYELITPEGAVYTMFSLSLKVDPNNTIENLPTLGERLTLPKGWKFRSRKLDKEMVLTATADLRTRPTPSFSTSLRATTSTTLAPSSGLCAARRGQLVAAHFDASKVISFTTICEGSRDRNGPTGCFQAY